MLERLQSNVSGSALSVWGRAASFFGGGGHEAAESTAAKSISAGGGGARLRDLAHFSAGLSFGLLLVAFRMRTR